MANRTITLELDDADFDTVQKALAKRQSVGRTLGLGQGFYPDGESNLTGMLIAEICRGWMQFLDSAS